MILKKAGIVTVGIGAALMAAAPMASASEHHEGHHGPTQDCSVNAGDVAAESGAGADGEARGDGINSVNQTVQSAARAAGGNAAGITCSSFLNDSFNITVVDMGRDEPKRDR